LRCAPSCLLPAFLLSAMSENMYGNEPLNEAPEKRKDVTDLGDAPPPKFPKPGSPGFDGVGAGALDTPSQDMPLVVPPAGSTLNVHAKTLVSGEGVLGGFVAESDAMVKNGATESQLLAKMVTFIEHHDQISKDEIDLYEKIKIKNQEQTDLNECLQRLNAKVHQLACKRGDLTTSIKILEFGQDVAAAEKAKKQAQDDAQKEIEAQHKAMEEISGSVGFPGCVADGDVVRSLLPQMDQLTTTVASLVVRMARLEAAASERREHTTSESGRSGHRRH